LALGAFFEILHQFGHFLFLWVAFTGQNFLPYSLAVRICSIALFGMGSVALSITFTALDRLLYVIFPLMFVQIFFLFLILIFFSTFMVRPAPYLAFLTLICLGFSCQNVWIYYKTAELIPNQMITGSLDDILSAVKY
jgi:hypothetical protein